MKINHMENQPQDIRLVAIDVDGTLLTNDHELMVENIEAIKEAEAQGIEIILASGRSPFAIQPFVEQLALNGYLITYNGAMASHIGSGKTVLNRPIIAGQTREIIQLVREFDLYTSLFLGMDYYIESDYPEAKWEAEVMNWEPIVVSDLVAYAPSQAHKFMVISLDDNDRLDKFYNAAILRIPQVNIYYQGFLYMEITHHGASKAVALAQTCGLLGVLPHQVMAIGNGVNDKRMLGYAGISVAVGNAHQSLLEIADWRVSANENYGVAEALYKIMSLRATQI
jgi:Cof subfamily protein (haloacid dehalogenase superfamily)